VASRNKSTRKWTSDSMIRWAENVLLVFVSMEYWKGNPLSGIIILLLLYHWSLLVAARMPICRYRANSKTHIHIYIW
jgi:hypothetical protein